MKETTVYFDADFNAVGRDDKTAFYDIKYVMPVSFVPRGQSWLEVYHISKKEIAKRNAAKAWRQAKDDVMKSCGLVKVRGAVSGKTYWE